MPPGPVREGGRHDSFPGMSIARFSLVVGVSLASLVALAGCSGPRHALIPVDSAILPWQPPEPAEGEGDDEQPADESADAPAPSGK